MPARSDAGLAGWRDGGFPGPTSGPSAAALAWSAFWGWRGGVRPVLDHRQQGEGRHHQRDVAVPAVPAAGLVAVEPELVLGGLERVLDRPAPALDADQHLERGAGRAPGGEVGQAGIAEAAPDEQATRPGAGLGAADLLGFEIRRLQVGPVVEPRPLGAVTRRETYPGRCRQASGDLFRRAGHRRLAPEPERARAGDPEHVALARLAQGRLDLAHAPRVRLRRPRRTIRPPRAPARSSR